MIACPSCGSGSNPGAAFCWLCGTNLGGNSPYRGTSAQQPQEPAAPPGAGIAAQSGRPSGVGWGWVVSAGVSAIVMCLIAVEIAFLAPGLLIPFFVLMVPVLIALGRMIYLHFFRKPPSAGIPVADGAPTAEASQNVGSKIVAGIAMGFVGLLGIFAVLALLFVAAMVMLFVICLGAIAVGQ